MSQDADGTTDEQCVNLDCCKLIDEKASVAPAMIKKMKNQYCLNSDHQQCARFHVYQALGIDAIPSLMLPNQKEWAKQIIADLGDKTSRKSKSVKSG